MALPVAHQRCPPALPHRHPVVSTVTTAPAPPKAPQVPSATTLAVIARELSTADSLPVLLDRLISAVPTVFGTAVRAGVVITSAGGGAVVAATDDLARRLDHSQSACGEGPSVSMAGGETDAVLVDDVVREDRWPTWREAIPPGLVGSCLALRLDAGRGAEGALTLYAATPHAFSVETVDMATAVAIHAGVAAVGVAKRDNLRIATESRDVIGQAKGILMERHHFTADEAFEVLIDASQRTNRKLRDVAEDLALTGQLITERQPR